jgi:hypothetical protein
MTTRLYPATVEGLAGITYLKLAGLSKTDTIAFFKTEGIAGTDEEMVRAGAVYGFHPLMLKLLSTAIKRSFTKDIKRAFDGSFLKKSIVDEKEPQKILATSYQLLNKEEQKVVSTISVFRTAFTFDAAAALFPDMDAEKLEGIMMELCNLGFVLYNEQQRLFDFHPILRSYLYDGLTGKGTIHQLAIAYFTALPAKERIVTLADLEPTIEQFHHLVRAGKYDEACDVYYDRLATALYFQLAQNELCISLCLQLFANTSDMLPALKKNRDKAYVLNVLGLSYAHTGQLKKASEYLLRKMSIDYGGNDNENLGIGLENISDQVHILLGRLLAGTIQLKKAAALAKEVSPFDEADGDRMLGYIMTANANYDSSSGVPAAKRCLDKAMEYCAEEGHTGLASSVSLDYTRWALAQPNDTGSASQKLQAAALNWGLISMDYAEQFRIEVNRPNLVFFLGAYEAIGRSFLAMLRSKAFLMPEAGQVLFYDEHFQQIIDAVTPNEGNYATLCERCINEGLVLSRKINRVYEEATFSLLLSQMEWLKVRDGNAEVGHLAEVEQIITETHALAQRIGHRMLLADLHLFCAEALPEIAELVPGHGGRLMGYTQAEHLVKVREYARDTSTLEDIFLPPDGSADEFYKDIPEYEMLKRGMTEEERVRHGYYAAWLRAERLEGAI